MQGPTLPAAADAGGVNDVSTLDGRRKEEEEEEEEVKDVVNVMAKEQEAA